MIDGSIPIIRNESRYESNVPLGSKFRRLSSASTRVSPTLLIRPAAPRPAAAFAVNASIARARTLISDVVAATILVV
jgi:hypothetical protein